MNVRALAAVTALLCLGYSAVLAAADASALVVVLDASESMEGRIKGESKIEIARDVLGDLVEGLADGSEVGLVAYGHRRKSDCADIESNPASLRITAGEYDLTLRSVEMDDHPERSFSGLAVEPQGEVEVTHDWESGRLRIGAVRDGRLVDALVQVSRASDGKTVAQGRVSERPDSNPKDFILEPGLYRVRVAAIRLPGRPSREFEIELKAGETASRPADFSQ